nr:hypothetical protein [Ktedonobacterales bacterium]
MIIFGTVGRIIRRHFPPSIRAQMTMFYTLTFAVLVLVILVVSLAFLRLYAPVTASAQLDGFAKVAATNISYQGGVVCVHPPLGTLPARDARLPLCQQAATSATATVALSPKLMMRVLDLQGHVLYVSPAFADLNISASATGLTLEELKHTGEISLKG